MEKKHKVYLRLNLMSLFFVAVSFISITLAWFAYSGLTTVNTEVNVKAWHIDFDSTNKSMESNDIIISLSQIYPGMDTVTETVNIKNLGDSDAQLDYSIVSARILDDTYNIDENHSLESLLDKLSHDYPFHINMSLNKNYILSKEEDGVFSVSVSWPLDSDTDSFDSEWGNMAYEFQDNERLLAQNPDYQARTSIKIAISLRAEQYIENLESSDINYNLGDLILYDVINNRSCETISETCIRTNIIDVNSKIGDTTVTLLPDLDSGYTAGRYSDFDALMASNTSGWNVVTRRLTTDDILKVISTNINDSFLIREGISNSLIGYLGYNNRVDGVKEKTSLYNGVSYFSFQNPNFIYFSTGNCYWTYDEVGYNVNNGFALKRIDLNTSKLYAENKNTLCGVAPVIIAPKSNL